MDIVKLRSKTGYTKREVASLAAKIFDPIGLIASFSVRSKLIPQSLWTKGVGWDEKIPMEVSLKWNQWVQELSELEHLRIPRYYSNLTLSQTAQGELHGFFDASEVAYASAVCRWKGIYQSYNVQDPSGSFKEDYPSGLRVDGCYNYC